MSVNNVHTIGEGKLLFKPYGALGFIDLGKCSDFKVSVTAQRKGHFTHRDGIKKKNDEIITEITASADVQLEQVNLDNLNIYLLGGTITNSTQTSGSLSDYPITAIINQWIDCSKDQISDFTVNNLTKTINYIENTDYKINYEEGLFMAIDGGAITEGQSLLANFSYSKATIKLTGAGRVSRLVGDVYFIGNPPVGRKLTLIGYASITPKGNLSLSDGNWITLELYLEFLENENYDGLYELIDRGNV